MAIFGNSDIIYYIFDFLDKQSIFNCLMTCKILNNYFEYIYKRFSFNYQLIFNEKEEYKKKIKYLSYVNLRNLDFEFLVRQFPNLKFINNCIYNENCNLGDEIKKYIVSLKIYNTLADSLSYYSNLKKVVINNNEFNKDIDFLPDSIEELVISSCVFNTNISTYPQNLKNLSIESQSFNHPINIPNGLEKLIINCPIFNQRIFINSDCLCLIKIKVISQVFISVQHFNYQNLEVKNSYKIQTDGSYTVINKINNISQKCNKFTPRKNLNINLGEIINLIT